MHFDRRLITHFEWLLPLLVLAVCVLGIMTVTVGWAALYWVEPTVAVPFGGGSCSVFL